MRSRKSFFTTLLVIDRVRDVAKGLNAVVCDLPYLRGEVAFWKRRYEFLAFKDKEKPLSLLLVAETAALSNLIDVEFAGLWSTFS
jgi:hypothetical protein